MTTLENIKKICREKKNISITTLEQELGYSNGSLAKAKDIPSSRICEISNYLGVSMEYLMTGEETRLTVEQANLDVQLARQQKRIKEYMLKFANLSDDKRNQIMSLIDMLEDK
jgi:transcriptional regulator with XRE-family HTH domain